MLCAISFVAVSCGDSKDSAAADPRRPRHPRPRAAGSSRTTRRLNGGELVDYAQLSDAGTNTSFDPGLVQTLDESQVTTALYDGLTDFDFTDKCQAGAEGSGRREVDANADATEFTFTIKKGQMFSNGDPVLPSSFKYALGAQRTRPTSPRRTAT